MSETTARTVCNCCGSSEWLPQFNESGIQLGRCPDCDLFSIGDMPSAQLRMTEMEAGHFGGNEKVVNAKRHAFSERALRTQFQAYVDLALRHVAPGRWLDIGCGAGLLLTLAREAKFDVEGIELTGDRYEIVRAAGYKVHNKPVEEIDYSDGTFAVISLINVFSHLTDPTATLVELRRILAPGGVIVVATGEMDAGVKKPDLPRWNLGDHLYFLGKRTMPMLAEKVGLSVADHQRDWMPDLMFSRPWLETKGGSTRRDLVKTVIARIPGAFPIFRKVMVSRHRGSGAYAATFALTKS